MLLNQLTTGLNQSSLNAFRFSSRNSVKYLKTLYIWAIMMINLNRFNTADSSAMIAFWKTII